MSKNGIINVIKPPGMTSFAVVKWLKKYFDCKKAGHTGTLDLLAAGVLPVCLGRATKIIPYLPETKKGYIGELTLGLITDTYDREGEIVEKNNDWADLKRNLVQDVFDQFRGRIHQIPPMYSAIQQQGKRLYKLARAGKTVEREPREVFIYKLNILEYNLPDIRFEVICSRGTYVRSLVRDIGRKLKMGAILSFLIRTNSGPFKLENAFTLEEISDIGKSEQNNLILPIDQPLVYPELIVIDNSIKKAVNGAYLVPEDFKNWSDNFTIGDRVTVYDNNFNFISVNEIVYDEDNIICKPQRVFACNFS